MYRKLNCSLRASSSLNDCTYQILLQRKQEFVGLQINCTNALYYTDPLSRMLLLLFIGKINFSNVHTTIFCKRKQSNSLTITVSVFSATIVLPLQYLLRLTFVKLFLFHWAIAFWNSGFLTNCSRGCSSYKSNVPSFSVLPCKIRMGRL